MALRDDAILLARSFVSPGQAFQAVAITPKWLPAFLLTVVIVAGSNFLVFHMVGVEQIVHSTLGDRPGAAEAAARAANSVIVQAILHAGALVTTALVLVAVAGAVALLFGVFASGARGRQLFAAAIHALLVYYAATSAVTVFVVGLMEDRSDFRLNDPLISSLGDFLDPDATGPFLASLASSLDVFTALGVCLLAQAVTTVSPTVKRGTVWARLLGGWAVYAVVKSAVVAMGTS